jgi:bifunctional oligoribonuclease and PAP phosphatase NrnA
MTPALIDFSPETHYLLCTHREPDPDGVGALLALLEYGTRAGYHFSAIVGECPAYMEFMPGLTLVQKHLPPVQDSPYTLLALDCGQKNRIWPVSALENAQEVWNMDHHFDNDFFGDRNLVQKECSSTSELLFHWMKSQLITRTLPMNENLMAGILFDTGGLRYPNTSTQTLAVVNELMQEGVSISQISEKIFSRWSVKSFKALSLALQYLECFHDEQFLLSMIPFHEIISAELGLMDFEGVVQALSEHQKAKIIAFVRETQVNEFKGSLRSKEGITVHDIAHQLDGGGHQLAAGFSSKRFTAAELRRFLMVEAGKKL